jgi:hypothetical protein
MDEFAATSNKKRRMSDSELAKLLADAIVKSFKAAKLTEGDVAFEDVGLDNEDIVGESTKPIDIDKTMSTMMPKQINNEESEPIEGDKQGYKLKKDYSSAPGSYSTLHQVPGEEANVVGPIEEVKDTMKRTNVSENKDSHFEKWITLDMEDSLFWRSINDSLMEDDIFGINKSYSEDVLIEDIVKDLESRIHTSIKKSLNEWFAGISKEVSIEDAKVLLRKSLIEWNANASQELKSLNSLLSICMKSWIRKAGIPTSYDSFSQLESSLFETHGSNSLIGNFINNQLDILDSIIESNDIGSYKMKKSIDSNMKESGKLIKSMIKDGVFNISNLAVKELSK